MKNIHYAAQFTQGGRNYAAAGFFKPGQNLLAELRTMAGLTVIQITAGRQEAESLAAEWNEAFRANGTSIFLG